MTQLNRDNGHPLPTVLNAFVDGELSGVEARSVEGHLDNCHPCSLSALAAMRLKAATGRAGERYAAPPEALARLTSHLRQETLQSGGRGPEPGKTTVLAASVRPRLRVVPGAWFALAAALLLVISIAGWRQMHEARALGAELFDQHLAMLASGPAPQVISTDRHTVKPWFQGRLPFSFNLPDADALPPDTMLRGADLVYLNGRPAALLIFTIHKHDVSVFVTQRGSLDIPPWSRRSGFALRSLTAAELRITAVSDVNPGELDALVAALAKIQ